MDKSDKPGKMRQEIVAELTALRIQFRDIMGRYQSNVEAEMVQCINSLTASNLDDFPHAAKDKKELAEILETFRLLKLKPQKGRLKDIKKINRVVNSVSDTLSNK